MATSEYAQVLASLYALEAAKGMDFKLERVALALRKLGDPHRQFAAVHIAGTNGKGSVAAMLHAMFAAQGYRVGLYTSPHLVSFTERIRVGAEEISEDTVVSLAREVRGAATVHGIELTFFEFVTVMAFLHFARAQVALAIIETGLGGRLDATNVIVPEVAVITCIGVDHQEYLGTTLQSVAREKAGIIKANCPVIVGAVPTEARHVLDEVATSCTAPVRWLGRDFAIAGDCVLRFDSAGAVLDDLQLALRGMHQRDNAAVAIATAVQLRARFPLSDAAIRRGLATVQWPGRLEIVETAPLVVLDGAHNVDGIAMLTRELPTLIEGKTLHLLFAVMRDKQWEPMIAMLGPVVATATVTATGQRRGEDPRALARHFERYCPTRVIIEPRAALTTVLQQTASNDAIVVTGSLFLVGAIYPFFLDQRGTQRLFSSAIATLHP